MIIESGEMNSPVIDGILKNLNGNPSFELLWLNQASMLSLPGLEIDTTHRKVYCAGKEVMLTAKEYALLCLLVANKGQVLTYEQIYQKVWKEDVFGNVNNAIKCHIHNLREKLNGTDHGASFAIRCVREVGYCLDVDSEEMVIT